MTGVPRATVVVPVRNRPELLAQALARLVDQDLPPADYEIVVCDDGSTEDIASVVHGFATAAVPLRLETQPPLGPAAARNLGVRASSAPIVVFVDSDVQVDRSMLRLLLDSLDEHPDWQGAEAALHPSGGETGVLWDAPASMEGGRYHTAAIAYRRSVLLAVGGFDETFKLPACEDVEIAVRVLQHGPIGFVPEATARHPRRRVTGATHWKWRRHWRYETILAVRYGILAFPGKRCGPLPRLRVAWAAVVTLPAGRFLAALRAMAKAPADGLAAGAFALFDVLCGLCALPSIILAAPPERRDYLAVGASRMERA